jgi:hypothetical protein
LIYGNQSNMYRYVRNNPVNKVDPTGLFNWSDFVSGFVSGLIGGAVGGLGVLINSQCPVTPGFISPALRKGPLDTKYCRPPLACCTVLQALAVAKDCENVGCALATCNRAPNGSVVFICEKPKDANPCPTHLKLFDCVADFCVVGGKQARCKWGRFPEQPPMPEQECCYCPLTIVRVK